MLTKHLNKSSLFPSMKVNLSVIIPVYKEERRITRCIEDSLLFFRNNSVIQKFELVFVADVSGDRTIAIIQSYLSKNKEMRLIVNETRLQKGGSVKKGMLAAKYDLLLYYDADLSTPLYEINETLALIQTYDIVIGSRGMPESHVEKRYFKIFLSKCFSFLKWLILGINLYDTQCGFKMFRRTTLPIFHKQQLQSSCFDVELLYIAKKHGFSIKEKPVTWIDSDMSNFNTVHIVLSFFGELAKIRMNAWKGLYDQ